MKRKSKFEIQIGGYNGFWAEKFVVRAFAVGVVFFAVAFVALFVVCAGGCATTRTRRDAGDIVNNIVEVVK